MILVTGGTGLVGCHLMYHLLTHNRKIVALRRESSDLNPVKKVFKSYTTNYESYLKKIDWIIGDINDIIVFQMHFKISMKCIIVLLLFHLNQVIWKS